MRLRTGKTIASGVVAAPITQVKEPSMENIEIRVKKDNSSVQQLAIISALTEKCKTTSDRVEKMKVISLVYDILFADKKFRESAECSPLIEVMRKNAEMNLENILSLNFLQLLDSCEVFAEEEHFRCLLENFISGCCGTPADYNDYSYHYDIMRKIGYNEAAEKRADIFNYAYTVDYDEDLVGDYIRNEVTVYELYAMVTYNTYTALPNSVSYDYCFNEVLSWYKRPIRE